MKPYSPSDWADPENPTPEEHYRWLTSTPTLGLALIATARNLFAEKKAAMTAEKRREMRALTRQLAHETASDVLRHIFTGILHWMGDYAEGRCKGDPSARQIREHLRHLAIARKYLPHLPPSERKEPRARITRLSRTLRDVLRMLPPPSPPTRRSRIADTRRSRKRPA